MSSLVELANVVTQPECCSHYYESGVLGSNPNDQGS